MRIVFFGTSDYCLPVLDSLKRDFDLALVVTRPDAPVGRKKILTPSAVKVWAEKNSVPAITPATLKKETIDRKKLTDQLSELHPDLAVVSDYGLIIPQEIFNIPKFGTLNIHFSKLPEFRGPSPVQATLLRSDTTAWVTIFKLENPPELKIKMDSGPILDQHHFPIHDSDTTENLYRRLFHGVAKYLPGTISNFASGQIRLVPQDHTLATYTKLLTRDDGFAEWSLILDPKAATDVYNRFRAMSPWPGLWTIHPTGKRLKILKCHLEKGKLILDEVQFEGGKPRPY